VVRLTTPYSSGARIRAAGAIVTKLCKVTPMFVCPQYGSCCMSPFWGSDSWAGFRCCHDFGKLFLPCYKSLTHVFISDSLGCETKPCAWCGSYLKKSEKRWFTVNPLQPSGNYMYRQLQHSQILRSAHTLFMYFVWIPEQTAIISIYSINWLVFITETESVYCAVRTGHLNIMQVNLKSSSGWREFLKDTLCVINVAPAFCYCF